jgi:PadR family transcriptional regulator PadR
MNFSKEIMKGTFEVIVLNVFRDFGEAYGYEILQVIKEQSANIFSIRETSLYPLLYRLEKNAIIKSKRKKSFSGKIRRYYFLTSKGKKLLLKRNEEFKLYLQGMKKLHYF